MLIYNSQYGSMDIVTDDGIEPNVCSAFRAVKIIIKTDGTRNLLIEVNDHHNFYLSYRFELPVSLLSDAVKLQAELLNNGLTVQSWWRGAALVYLDNEFHELAKKRYITREHDVLGWVKAKLIGLPVPHYGRQIPLPNPKDISKNAFFVGDSYLAEDFLSYFADKDFEFKDGTEQEYTDFLKTVIFPNDTLSLALAIGFSAPIASRLADETGFSTLLVNLCGSSSSGKTTAQMLMVSPFANPNPKGRGLFLTFQATQNALLAGMGNINGFPIALDDSSTNPNANFTNLIYSLADGHGRKRCNSDGSLKDSQNWSGTVIVSSEIPLQEQANNQQGILARVLTLKEIAWTPDSHTAELIKRTVKHCYGHTGVDFGSQYCGTDDYYALAERYYLAKERVHALMPFRDNLSDRLEAQYAIIYLTIQELNEFFEELHPNLDADKLIQIALAGEQASVAERDISQKALDIISEFILQKRFHFNEYHIRNSYNFPTGNRPNREIYGAMLFKENSRLDVYISRQILEERLREKGIGEFSTVLKRWKERGVISCEKDRLEERMPKLDGFDKESLKRRYIHFIFLKGLHDVSEDNLYVPYDGEPEAPQTAETYSENLIEEEGIPADFPDDYCGYDYPYDDYAPVEFPDDDFFGYDEV